MASQIKRGVFIVFEGCDRTGKSTQSRLLLERLKAEGYSVQQMGFPNRQSNIGQVINKYLTNKVEMSDECIHLLFSANRWECKKEIEHLLKTGVSLVVDRYSYSGVAYSVAKGLNYDWCVAPEKGLIRPDAVFYLKASTEQLQQRGAYGEERYEKLEFQQRVSDVFDRIYATEQSYWHAIDASQTEEVLSGRIAEKAMELMEEMQVQPIKWLQ